MDAIKGTIMNTLEKILGICDSDVANEVDLGQLGLDSLKTVNLIVELEMAFNIVFENDELLFENFSSIQKIVNQIEGKLA
ncbi:acyl carrier protein [compost metagenome]